MAEFDRLIKQADKAVQNMGGLLLLLLAVKRDDNLASVSWDAEKLQFIINGQPIPFQIIRKQLETLESKLVKKIIEYNTKLFNKTWNLAQWKAKMQELVENSHVLFAALAVGGIIAAVASPIVERKIERDQKALNGFATALKTKRVSVLTQAINRSKAYLRSAYVTYHLIEHNLQIALGKKEARRILRPAEHCRTRQGLEGCFEVSAKSWIPIRDMPPIGTLLCGQFCKCFIIYR